MCSPMQCVACLNTCLILNQTRCAAVAANNTCGADSDCSAAAGQVCNTAAGSNTKVCSCKDGIDTCVWRGVCTSFCATQADYIAERNSLVRAAFTSLLSREARCL
jgi:hypothetical protein